MWHASWYFNLEGRKLPLWSGFMQNISVSQIPEKSVIHLQPIIDPFDCSSNDLRSLSTGLSATDDDGISCDRAEEIGLEIQKTLDEVNVADATIKRKKQVKTLSSLTNNVKIGKTDVEIDPKILFMRLIAMIQREDNICNYFDYELTTTPLSLFKDGMMWKAQKVQLRHALVENISTNTWRVCSRWWCSSSQSAVGKRPYIFSNSL